MGFITNTRVKIDVPHEPGEWFEFQALTGAQLDNAERSASREAMKLLGGMEDSVLEAIRKQQNDRVDTVATEKSLDKDILIKFGVIDWSYDVPCDDENKGVLDAETREWAAAEVRRMNVRTAGEKIASTND